MILWTLCEHGELKPHLERVQVARRKDASMYDDDGPFDQRLCPGGRLATREDAARFITEEQAENRDALADQVGELGQSEDETLEGDALIRELEEPI